MPMFQRGAVWLMIPVGLVWAKTGMSDDKHTRHVLTPWPSLVALRPFLLRASAAPPQTVHGVSSAVLVNSRAAGRPSRGRPA
eukprot:3442924-Alexandrium_andersonii.AAC.1